MKKAAMSPKSETEYLVVEMKNTPECFRLQQTVCVSNFAHTWPA